MQVKLDRDMIDDSNVLTVDILITDARKKSILLGLSHKANGSQIELTKLELQWMLQEIHEAT